jgi:hypothetical protein
MKYYTHGHDQWFICCEKVNSERPRAFQQRGAQSSFPAERTYLMPWRVVEEKRQ